MKNKLETNDDLINFGLDQDLEELLNVVFSQKKQRHNAPITDANDPSEIFTEEDCFILDDAFNDEISHEETTSQPHMSSDDISSIQSEIELPHHSNFQEFTLKQIHQLACLGQLKVHFRYSKTLEIHLRKKLGVNIQTLQQMSNETLQRNFPEFLNCPLKNLSEKFSFESLSNRAILELIHTSTSYRNAYISLLLTDKTMDKKLEQRFGYNYNRLKTFLTHQSLEEVLFATGLTQQNYPVTFPFSNPVMIPTIKKPELHFSELTLGVLFEKIKITPTTNFLEVFGSKPETVNRYMGIRLNLTINELELCTLNQLKSMYGDQYNCPLKSLPIQFDISQRPIVQILEIIHQSKNRSKAAHKLYLFSDKLDLSLYKRGLHLDFDQLKILLTGKLSLGINFEEIATDLCSSTLSDKNIGNTHLYSSNRALFFSNQTNTNNNTLQTEVIHAESPGNP